MELIGQRFGHIRVTEVVGQGGMGEVYAGYDEKLERKVAVKVLNADQRLDAAARERLLREARALSLLDHPNICRIFDYLENEEVDLLVLEYIDGPTLDQVSASLSRSEKLRIASAIASVLVAAHRAGIVHRDLKPENVMLTSTGEVKVLDFGLARLLRRTREAGGSSDRYRNVVPMLPVRSSSDTLMLPTEFDSAAPNGTAVGVTLGTPLYMSPEQARGDALTSASDMYSFGLLLQMLFTGSEPHPQGMPAREIILRVARGDTNPVTGVQRDVANLLSRLKQMAPADRPAAVEALASIEHMRQRSQRIVKWTTAVISALVLLFIGWRYTADLKHERTKAVAAQAEAEKRRAQAEDLINFMVGDLRTKLDGVGRIDILDDVSKKTLRYVSNVDPTRMNADELARFAKVLHQLGEVQIVRGDTAAALPLFGQSLDLSKAAIAREPRNPAARLAYAISHCWIGEVHRQRREYPPALESMREYMNVTEKLAHEYPGNAEYQYEWTSALNNVGILLEAQGDVPAALEHYKVSLAARSEAVRRKPDDLKLLADLAAVLNKIGVANHKLGALPIARDYFRRELETYRTLVGADPKQSQWRHRMSVSLGYLALMHWYMGDADGAQALWREELSIDRELAERDPKNIPWQRNPPLTTRRLANVSEMRGELQQSQAMLQEARARLEALQKEKPREANVAAAINAVDLDLGRVLAANGSRARARTVLENVIARVEKSSDRASQITLARAVNTLGETFRESDPPRAEAAWRRAEQLLEPLVQSTNDVLERDLWCRVLVHRGRCADARRELGQLRLARYDTRAVDKVLGLEGCK